MKKMKIEYKISKSRIFKKYNKDGSFTEYNLSKKSINNILSYISDCILTFGVDLNGYVNIPKRNFRNFNNGEEVVDCLLLDGLLERNYFIYNDGKNKNKAYGYRFTERLKEKLEIVNIICEPSDFYIDNVVCKESRYDLNIDKYVLDRVEKDFNSSEVVGLIEKEYDEWGNFIDMSKWLSNNLKIKRWQTGHKIFSWSSNRLYTNFTMLSSSVRKNNIRLSGEEIVEFDISSSFPLMLCLYCFKINPDIINDYEFQEFSKSILRGTFYSKLQYGLNNIRNCNKDGKYDSDGDKITCDYSTRLLSKNEVKKIFSIFLNDKTEKNAFINNISVDIKRYMKHNYSSIYDIVEKIKDEDKVYDVLVANETKIIFDIIKELYDTFEDIKILTCHDAIYVPKSYEQKVSLIWEKWMNKMFNKLPKMDEYIDYSFQGDLFN